MNIQHFPLEKLELSPLNPRKTKPAPGEIEALAASIHAVHLQQNLIGFLEYPPVATNDIPVEPVVQVVGGGRRLRALQLLDKEHGPITPVPVQIHDNPDAAVAAAIAENEARKDMGPLDKLDAYAAQVDAGLTEAQCARMFGVSEAETKQILALRVVAEPILAALAEGEISLDIARAFSVTTDKQAQLARFDRLSRWCGPRDIRRDLKKETISNERLQRLGIVGREAYLAAGGRITEDLFSDEVYVEDGDVLDRVWAEFIGFLADKAEAEGWRWLAEIPAYNDRPKIERLYPKQGELPKGDAARYNGLAELAEAEMLDGDDAREFEELQARLDAEEWTADQKSVSGIWVSIDYQGKLDFMRGIVLPTDINEAVELGVLRDNAKPIEEDDRPEVNRLDDAPASLVDDLRAVRLSTTAHAVAGDLDLALDLLAWTLTEHKGYERVVALGHADSVPGEPDKLGAPAMVPHPEPGEGHEAVPFDEFRKLPEAVRRQPIAEMIASRLRWRDDYTMLGVTLEAGTRDIRATVPIERSWLPGESYFNRLKGDQLDLLWLHLTGKEMLNTVKSKKDKAGLLAQLFREPYATLRKLEATDPTERAQVVEEWTPAQIRPRPIEDLFAEQRENHERLARLYAPNPAEGQDEPEEEAA
jgi:ParB family chromosome partitioning protein